MNTFQPIRVLQVVHKMHRAGVETLLMRIYRHIDRNKVQFDFLVHADQPGHYDDEICELGGRIIPIAVSPSKNYLLYTKVLRNVLLEYGPYGNIHSHLLLLSGIILDVAYGVNIPQRIVHSHSANDSKSSTIGRSIYGWYMRHQIGRFATHMLAVSGPAAEWLYGKKCWQDPRVKVIHNAIDLKPFEMLSQNRSRLRQELSLPGDGILLGHIGRFEKEKNHKKVLEIFGSLVKLQPAAYLILIGEGTLEAEIRSSIRSSGLQDKVYMLGVRSDIPELLGALDLFLFPSLCEGLGVALIEAQAAGVVCLVSDAIPTEADLGLGLVKALPLFADSKVWAETALSMLSPLRVSWPAREKALKKHNHDISVFASKLQELYCHELIAAND